MTIRDIFPFEGGRKVFTGEVRSGPAYIRAGACELLIRGEVAARFTIEGEMLPLRKQAGALRALSTTANLDPELLLLARQDGELRAARRAPARE